MRAPRPRFMTLVTVSSLVALAVSGAPACVPPGNAVPEDSGAATPQASAAAVFIPSVGVMTEVFFDDFDRKPHAPDAAASPSGSASAVTAPTSLTSPSEAGAVPNEAGAGASGRDTAKGTTLRVAKPDAHPPSDGGTSADARAHAPGEDPRKPTDPAAPHPDTSNLGPDWTQAKTTAWRVENGWLCGQSAKNHGVWLNRVLPINARIEFDARSESGEGDLKAEVWGDGQSAATTVSYTNATSYLAILGGWKNTIHVLARINEHGTDRHELHVDKESDDARKRPVAPGQSYHFKIERLDGKTVRWAVNGAEMHSFTDSAPLQGMGHDHFGFNDWDAKVCFDNVRVTPL